MTKEIKRRNDYSKKTKILNQLLFYLLQVVISYFSDTKLRESVNHNYTKHQVGLDLNTFDVKKIQNYQTLNNLNVKPEDINNSTQSPN